MSDTFLRLPQIIGNRNAEPPIQPIIPVCKTTWWAGDLPPSCRTKVMEQSPLISENSGYETIQIYR